MSKPQSNDKCLQASRNFYKTLPVSILSLEMIVKGRDTFRYHATILSRQVRLSWLGLIAAALFGLIFGLNGEAIAAVSSIVLSVVLLLVASSL